MIHPAVPYPRDLAAAAAGGAIAAGLALLAWAAAEETDVQARAVVVRP